MPSSATTYLSSSLFFKPQCDALAVSLHRFQPRAVIPRERGQPFPNNIRSSNPTLVELRAEEMNP